MLAHRSPVSSIVSSQRYMPRSVHALLATIMALVAGAGAHAILYGLLAGITASALMALMYHGDILSRQYSSFFLFETVVLLLAFPVLSMLWARLLRQPPAAADATKRRG